MTVVHVGTHVHTSTYVATSLLRSIKWLITAAGLSASKFASDWSVWEEGVAHWIRERSLERLILEVYDSTDWHHDLRGRFDFRLSYSYGGDGSLWIDPDIVAFTVRKNGSLPSACAYRLVATTKPFATDPPEGNWTSATLRSTAGFQRHSVGTALAGGTIGASLSYYRRVN